MEFASADQGALGGPWQGEATRAAIIRARAPAAVRHKSQQTAISEEAEAVIVAARASVPCEGSLAEPLEQIALQIGPGAQDTCILPEVTGGVQEDEVSSEPVPRVSRSARSACLMSSSFERSPNDSKCFSR